MAKTAALLFVAKLVISFLFAALVIYLVDGGDKQLKRKRIDELLSHILQFVIYIWLAKIVWGLPLLFSHPLSVLAYPSNSTHFYIATGCWMIHFLFKYRNQEIEMKIQLDYFLWGVLAAWVMYYFLEISFSPMKQLDTYFIVLFILFLMTILLYEKHWIIPVVSLIWFVISFILSLNKGYLHVFNYFLHPSYFIVMDLLLGLLYYKLRHQRGVLK